MSRFFDFNKKLSMKLYSIFPHSKYGIFADYINTVRSNISSDAQQYIVDVGAGKRCHYVNGLERTYLTIAGIDISEEELKYNTDLDEKIICDVTKEILLPYNTADIVTSRSVIEHLRDTEQFIINAGNILKEGGLFISFFPGKYSLFAILNQILPTSVSKLLLEKVHGNQGTMGFKAYYDKCYYSKFIPMLEKHGFNIVEVKLSYRSSSYFAFFTPLFLVSAIYEYAISALKIKNLSSYILVIARKKKNSGI